jgi:virginiamycin B lyase
MGNPAAKLVAAIAVLLSLAVPTAAAAAPAVDGFFPVTGLAINNKIVAGPDGNMWVTLAANKDVARITPSGEVQGFDLDGVDFDAEGIAPGPDGNLWVPTINEVTRFSPGDPEGTDKAFTLGGIGASSQIVAGPDGRMWVASNNSLLSFDVGDPAGTEVATLIEGGLSPKDVDVAGSLIAVADFNNTRVATFTTAGAQANYALKGSPQGVAGGPGGQIAFSQQSVEPEEVGRIDPPGPALGNEIDGDPFGVALGPDGAYWIARSAKGELIRLTTTGEVTTLSGLPPKYFPRQVAGGPGGTVWATMEIPGEEITAVARVSGVEPEAVTLPAPPALLMPAPQTKIKKGPKKIVKTKQKQAKVKFRFSSPTAGAGFQCSLVKLKGKATKKVSFKGCKSPKRYRLRPGRYRFKVRAVNAGVVDPTPAVRKFKIVRVHR